MWLPTLSVAASFAVGKGINADPCSATDYFRLCRCANLPGTIFTTMSALHASSAPRHSRLVPAMCQGSLRFDILGNGGLFATTGSLTWTPELRALNLVFPWGLLRSRGRWAFWKASIAILSSWTTLCATESNLHSLSVWLGAALSLIIAKPPRTSLLCVVTGAEKLWMATTGCVAAPTLNGMFSRTMDLPQMVWWERLTRLYPMAASGSFGCQALHGNV